MPLIVLSAVGDKEPKVRALEAGANTGVYVAVRRR
jgi:DNA-binding response OmpR family regulator